MKHISRSAERLRNMSSVYLTCNEKVLLLYRQGSRVVNDVWTGSAGGHFEPHELNDPRACALRELHEELSVTEDMLECLSLRYIALRRTGEEIRQNYYFFAELKRGDTLPLASNEGIIKWFPLTHELHALQMPFTAQYMIAHYLDTGIYTDRIYCGIAGREKVVFSELAAF